jgi:hypothetical protein
MSQHSSLRASDADRDAIAERLHRAAVEGRLDADELEQRLHLALRARTYGELGRLVADLPGRREPGRRRAGAPLVLTAAIRLVALVALITVVLVVAAFTAAWWIVWALLWLTIHARRRPRRRMGRPMSPRLRGI